MYSFSFIDSNDTFAWAPEAGGERQQFASFLGFVTDVASGQPVPGARVEVYDRHGVKVNEAVTDEDGYYLAVHPQPARAGTYVVRVPAFDLSASVEVLANSFARLTFAVS